LKIRKKNRGLIYLRRSSGRQELSLGGQLEWAIERASQEAVSVDASLADLEYMQGRGMHSFKDIRLDDAISGADMERPGFLAIQADVVANKHISHLFIHMRDRFGRPQEAMEMALIEKSIRMRGVTIMLSNGIGLPLDIGNGDLAGDLQIIVEYYMSGDFLRKLAERILIAQRHLASIGRWTGGSAPYGCVRVLVNSAGEELLELPPGRTARQSGCHVQLRPRDETKITWWLLMLNLIKADWGSKRIANYLNKLGVPSPDAGKVRRDHGVARVIDGKWNHRTVLDLLRNPAIIGRLRYGRRSMGKHRRLGAQGPRTIEEGDHNQEGKLRVIHNAESLLIRQPGGYDARYSVEEWLLVQQKIDARGESQKGIPRASDATKYPGS